MLLTNLYNLRLKMKKDKNPAQVVILLLMNSMYGETIIEPVETVEPLPILVIRNGKESIKYNPRRTRWV